MSKDDVHGGSISWINVSRFSKEEQLFCKIHANSLVFLSVLLSVVFCCSIASMDGNGASPTGEQANFLLPGDGKQAVPVPVPARGEGFSPSASGGQAAQAHDENP